MQDEITALILTYNEAPNIARMLDRLRPAVDIAEVIAQVKLKRRYNLDAPKGVRGRNSDNTLILEKLKWEPSIRLRDGMEKTYQWIGDQILRGQKSLVY